MRAPLVSVVIPTWNRGQMLGEAVASVIAQSVGDWELIVVDDGSTDGSIEALAAFDEPRLRLLRLPRDGNVARVRNAGVSEARGRYVGFLDADDLWLPHKLERQLAALARGGARWSYGRVEHIDAAGAPIPPREGRFAACDGHILEALVADQTAAAIGTLLVERSLVDEVGGFDDGLIARHDLDFEFRVAAIADAVCVDETLALVRDHGARFTRGLSDPHERTARVFERLIARGAEAAVLRAARRRLARLRADAGLLRLVAGETRPGLALVARAVMAGAGGYVAARIARRIRSR